MQCDETRDILSARLDGEAAEEELARADEHLGGCAACAAWLDTAQGLDLMLAADHGDADLGDERIAAILTAAPRPRRHLALTLRYALGLLGLAQFLLGVAQISANAGATHLHGTLLSGTGADHLWHESAAWNVAVGAAFAWVAWRRSRPAGVLPMLTAFVLVLTLLTVNDALTGTVDTSRILSHILLVAGYALLVVLGRPRFTDVDPPRRRERPGWRMRLEEDGPLATVHPLPIRPQPTARYRKAA
ncbi:zf-HC2 domain-containing protein [Hamadaea tsunoensis]|uniref:zf-HC2 domain-containing protein n=1 Tax=Hamadaea tsunoensis TaxID=53368 RepID=UPI0004195F95|nr:zf-HC2 domain-containing protein [Hamadaea tsunoensis]